MSEGCKSKAQKLQTKKYKLMKIALEVALNYKTFTAFVSKFPLNWISGSGQIVVRHYYLS